MSNFDPHHVAYSVRNKNKLGVLKFEITEAISEFAGLKAKQYAFSYGNSCKKTAKGISKNVVKTFNFDNYKDTLMRGKSLKETQTNIRSKKHILYTFKEHRRGLSAYYDKSYVLQDGLNCLSYGHYRIADYI